MGTVHIGHDFVFVLWCIQRTVISRVTHQLQHFMASYKSNPLSIPWGIVDSDSTLPWVMWEAVTVVEGTP